MGRIANFIWILIIVIIVAVAGIATYLSFALPNVGAEPVINVQSTPARIARGKYLATAVTACISCHSKHNFNNFAAPIIQNTLGAGGGRFTKETDFPGVLYAPNITPYGLHNWTDGELLRAITAGETKDGEAIFPIMPYRAYANMCTEDAYSIIVYLRTLPAVKNDVPQRQLDFPLNFIVNTIPSKATLVAAAPDSNKKISYGKYLVSIANCIECHSIMGSGNIVAGSEFGGGWPFKLANGTVIYGANISPDNETGIGKWTAELFIKEFKQYTDSSMVDQSNNRLNLNTTMPWNAYAAMTNEDLTAIFLYLQTVKPINNKVQKMKR